MGTKTRIDFFLIPKIIRQTIIEAKIIKNTFSDHNGVFIKIKLLNKKYKKTPWKLNNKLIDDPNICQDFKIYWEKFQEMKIDIDHHLWWDIGNHLWGEQNSKKTKTREALLLTTLECLSVFYVFYVFLLL